MIKDEQDSSGTISTVELLHVLRAMGQNPSEEELNGIIMEIDIDGSGSIDFDEFVSLMKDKALEVDVDNDIREAFRMFDRNKDGYIDMSELRKMFALVGGLFSREEMEEFMMEADKVRVKLSHLKPQTEVLLHRMAMGCWTMKNS